MASAARTAGDQTQLAIDELGPIATAYESSPTEEAADSLAIAVYGLIRSRTLATRSEIADAFENYARARTGQDNYIGAFERLVVSREGGR